MAVATADITYQVNLDAMTPVKEIKSGYLAYGDNRAHTFHAECLEAGEPASLSGVTVVGVFVRPDQTAVELPGTIKGNTASITLTQECYAVPGECAVLIRLVHADGTKRVALWLRATVLETEFSQTVNPGEPLPNIDDLLAAIDRMNQASTQVAAAVAEESTFNARLTATADQVAEDETKSLLTADIIPDSTQELTRHTEKGTLSMAGNGVTYNGDEEFLITHKRGTAKIREDHILIDHTTGKAAEIRTAGTHSLEIVTNMNTLKTEVKYA